MSSPRKFAEKIALIQQKQAEGDAAFNTIIYEVEAAKQRADHVATTNSNLNVPLRKYEKPFEGSIGSNGMINSDSNHYNNQSLKIENNNGSDRLLQLPDNTSWRRTHSDSSLHQTLMPTVASHYNARFDNENNDQQINYNLNDIKYEPTPYDNHHYQHLQQSTIHYQPYDYYDLNNNNNYANDPTYVNYSSLQQPTPPPPSTTTNNTHTLLGPRFSGGNNNSNVLMLPPSQHPRGSGGGSLPDLRTGNGYNNQQVSYSTVPSPPTSTTQQFLRSSSPHQNGAGGDGDLFALGPQQRLRSNIGPLKTSPSMRRRHSPIGEGRQSSPRRQNSPSPDVSSVNQPPNHYRVEPSSPQSQSSYSPQNSPHLLSSPANEHAPFSPSTDNQQQHQPYFTLPNHFDQITLDHNFYTQQQQQQPTSPLSQNNHNHSLSTTSILTNENNLNYLGQTNFYSSFMDDLPSAYSHTQTTVTVTTNGLQKSPTIPNIILTDADSSKLDLSKELGNDFSAAFDSLIDPTDLQLNTDDFLLNVADLSVDPINCDDVFRMER